MLLRKLTKAEKKGEKKRTGTKYFSRISEETCLLRVVELSLNRRKFRRTVSDTAQYNLLKDRPPGNSPCSPNSQFVPGSEYKIERYIFLAKLKSFFPAVGFDFQEFHILYTVPFQSTRVNYVSLL